MNIRVDEVLILVDHALDQDDLDRAIEWAELALSVNDPKESADA